MNHPRGNSHGMRPPELPQYTVKTFKDFSLSELIKEEAQKVAQRLNDEKGRSDTCNKNSQIRRFYDELMGLKQKTEAENADFNRLLPAVYMVVSKCAYAQGRKLVSKTFYEFIRQNVHAVKNKEDLDSCVTYIEAVLGYYKMLNPTNN